MNASLEETGEEELKRLKREHAIRERIAEAERKRNEDQERKRLDLEKKREELERKAEEKKQQQLRGMAHQAKLRAEKKAKRDKLDKKRSAKIRDTEIDWLERTNRSIQQKLDDADAEDARMEHELNRLREAKNARALEKLRDKLRQQAEQAERDMIRAEKNDEQALARTVRELHTIDNLKTEAQDEIVSFLMHPAPVPLKQVLAGRTRPVPRVTELLVAHKDQREDLKELEDADIPTRALMRNQTLFKYVHDIEAKFEQSRIKVPQPAETDAARRAGGRKGPSSPKGRKSSPGRKPTSPMRKSGTSWASRTK